MSRVNTVVARRCGQQDGRVRRLGVDVVVGRVGAQEVPIIGVGVAVLTHPARAGQQHIEPFHVEQRHLAHDRPKEQAACGWPREHVASQQPAVGAALAAELRGGCDAACDEIPRDRLKVLEGLVAILLERRLVPPGPVLAAAANVGLHVRVALLKPRRAGASAVAGSEGDLEASIAVEQGRRRAVERHVGARDQEIGHLRAIGGSREELLRREPLGVEEGGQRLQRLHLLGRDGVGDGEGGGLGVALARHPDGVGALRVHRREARRHAHLASELPLQRKGAVGVLPEAALGNDVVETREEQVVLRLSAALERHALRRREQRREQRRDRSVVRRRHEARDGRREHRSCRVAEPRRAQRDQQLVGESADGRVGGHADGREGRLADLELVARRVESERAVAQLVAVAAVEVGRTSDRDVRLLALVDLGRLAEGRAALPLEHGARVARVRHLGLAESAADQQRVTVLVRELRLGLRQLEAAIARSDERLRIEVELARDLSVGAAARERDHHALLTHLGPLVKERRAAPHPRDAVGRAQRVEVQDELPRWLRLPVLVERAPAPDTLHVLLVLPEVVVFAVEHAADVRDLLVALHDGEQPRVALRLGGLADPADGLGIARFDPVELLLSLDVLEPLSRIRQVAQSWELRCTQRDGP
mmetsp:Transcript_40208/g.93844  ORF Transcript_40208/g.93844 Transcript_40208/m.93844 type:complete len:650 (-) Transcript_40208:97-2046(-)